MCVAFRIVTQSPLPQFPDTEAWMGDWQQRHNSPALILASDLLLSPPEFLSDKTALLGVRVIQPALSLVGRVLAVL